MDNNQVTAEWIAQQRQISEIVNMTYEDAPGSVVPLLKQLEKSQTAALDALEASMRREAEKDVTIARLTAERDAEKRRADAAVLDLERVMKLAHEWKDVDAVCEVCVTECKRTVTGTGRHFVCTKPKWRGPCAENAQEVRE